MNNLGRAPARIRWMCAAVTGGALIVLSAPGDAVSQDRFELRTADEPPLSVAYCYDLDPVELQSTIGQGECLDLVKNLGVVEPAADFEDAMGPIADTGPGENERDAATPTGLQASLLTDVADETVNDVDDSDSGEAGSSDTGGDGANGANARDAGAENTGGDGAAAGGSGAGTGDGAGATGGGGDLAGSGADTSGSTGSSADGGADLGVGVGGVSAGVGIGNGGVSVGVGLGGAGVGIGLGGGGDGDRGGGGA